MDVVGIFASIHAAGLEPDITFGFIDAIYAVHHPVAAGNGVFDATLYRIYQVEMIIAILFTAPDDLIGFGRVPGKVAAFINNVFVFSSMRLRVEPAFEFTSMIRKCW
jgi:hypothetical protein